MEMSFTEPAEISVCVACCVDHLYSPFAGCTTRVVERYAGLCLSRVIPACAGESVSVSLGLLVISELFLPPSFQFCDPLRVIPACAGARVTVTNGVNSGHPRVCGGE